MPLTQAPTDLMLVGCGYAADFYLANLPNHPELRVAGVYDRVPERAQAMGKAWNLPVFDSLERLLSQNRSAVVLNLTNPTSHVEVTSAALRAGHHVYSEKPFAPTMAEGRQLLALAEQKGLSIASAPCTVLGEAFQTALRLEREGAIGRSRLAVAHLHEGAIHLMRHDRWIGKSGSVWPAADEFATGCVREHSGYLVDLLVALWGPVRTVKASSATIFSDKGVKGPVAADWATAVLGFDDDRYAHLTFSIVEASDHRLTVIGDGGTLVVNDVWRYDSPVRFATSRRASPEAPHTYLDEFRIVPPLEGVHREHRYRDTHDIDLLRGVADLVDSVREGRRPRLDASHALHVLEATLAIADSTAAGTVRLKTVPPVFSPPCWAYDYRWTWKEKGAA